MQRVQINFVLFLKANIISETHSIAVPEVCQQRNRGAQRHETLIK